MNDDLSLTTYLRFVQIRFSPVISKVAAALFHLNPLKGGGIVVLAVNHRPQWLGMEAMAWNDRLLPSPRLSL